ncbi:MAG: efflux RND transporter periplasmic adaptor subunit [Rhodobacteraceae bacterium]|nr:efflux RND transporter periplasmic adaptor subunit [Paracoccaceae bacterium]
MRLFPILTAIVVAAALYLLVFERSALLSYARGDTDAGALGAAVSDGIAQEPVSDADTGDAIETAAADPGVSVVAMKSLARHVDSAVLVRGRTEAARQVDLRAETSGTIISDPLRKGALVAQGDEVCRLDPGTRQIALAEATAHLQEAQSRLPEARARVAEATARLKEAEINDNAATRLSEGGFASDTRVAATGAGVESARAGVEAARSGIDAAEAGIQSAQAGVAAAKNEIGKLIIRAPFGGLLESDGAEVGSLLQPGGLCATVIRLDPIKLVGFVPETDVDKVTVGAIAGARLATGRDVRGEVTFLSRSADPTTRTFRVEVLVANDDLLIRDGQTVEIAIGSDGANAHFLPQSALTLDNEGALGVRLVGEDDLVTFAPVSVLRDTPDGIWVQGLPEAANVIVVGQEFVVAGVRVDPTYREEATQ